MKSKVYSLIAANVAALVYPVLSGLATIFHLGVVDGRHYIAVPPGLELPEQPAALDLKEEDISHGEIRETLKKVSGDYRVMTEAIQARIRSRYSVSDELQAIRTGDAEYQAFVESVLQEFAPQKAMLGF